MKHEDAIENREADVAVIIITDQLEVATRYCKDQLEDHSLFKLAVLECLIILLLGDENGADSHSVSDQHRSTVAAIASKFMERIKPRLSSLSSEEMKYTVIAIIAEQLAREVLPKMIEQYSAGLPARR